MRIISGMARGLKLNSLEGSDTRPTLDNVKEAIFSMLFLKCQDSLVLDLFAGSGALGIEALSRGAKKAVFVDANPKACAVCRDNLKKARLDEVSEVVSIDAKRYLASAAQRGIKFDLVFLDPPYSLNLLDEALSLISEFKLLADGGLVICEFDSVTRLNITNYKLVKDKRYGRVCVNILEALS